MIAKCDIRESLVQVKILEKYYVLLKKCPQQAKILTLARLDMEIFNTVHFSPQIISLRVRSPQRYKVTKIEIED